jgi:hypothetical protein
MICRRCHRPLENPDAVSRGIGEVCARRAVEERARRGMLNEVANFSIVEEDLLSVTIRDLGPWDKFKTVTNAAEFVVETLVAAGRLPEGKRLFYFDSEGELDELLIQGGRFAGFKAARTPEQRARAI